MMTRKQAIEFCEGRRRMHLSSAEKIEKENDLFEDEIAIVKYNSILDLAAVYGDIATMLKEGE